MTVKLDKANYGNYLYYRIICDIPYEGSNNPFAIHPFMRLEYENKTEIGNVIADNEMVRKMFDFLVMPDIELAKYSGNSSPISYRASIIECISLLWD